jgi:hypothetical protein
VAQQNAKYNAIAKEVSGMISRAYQRAKQDNIVSTTTRAVDLLPYMNYVTVVTTGLFDGSDFASGDCSQTASRTCIRLHNGALLSLTTRSFNGSAANNAVPFALDPDGAYTGNQDSLSIYLYYNGRLTTFAHIVNNTCDSGFCNNPYPDPDWFSWTGS